jgi:hypothetical protein
MSVGSLIKLAKTRGIPVKGNKDKQKIIRFMLCNMEVTHILKGGC